MKNLTDLLTLINAGLPGVAQLIVTIKNNDGTETTVTLLDSADKQFDDNITQAQDWLAAHPSA